MEFKNPNNTTNLESLYFALVMLLTDNKQAFCYAYKKAMHDSNGASCWNLMYCGRCSQHYQRDRKARIKERQKNE